MLINFKDNSEAQDVINIINYSNDSIFVTGRAGTGKTTLLHYIQSQLKKQFIVLAPTGNTALNAGGKTIHSFFQLAPIPVLPSNAVNFKYNRNKRKIIEKLELLIIDEVSMVRADILDAINKNLQYYRNSDVPFGGVQVLLVGDSFQLPPITKKEDWEVLRTVYSSTFFFDALVFKYHDLITIELLKVYRQQQNDFIALLDAIRLNKVNESHLQTLKSRVIEPNDSENGLITITAVKAVADTINNQKLASIKYNSHIYSGIKIGTFKDLPTKEILELKVSSQVMLIKNDYKRRWVNGSIGIVSELGDDYIKIRLNDNQEVKVEKEVWNNYEFKYDKSTKAIISETVGTFTQLPIALCWAMTIHKSQGLTFDKLIVDFGNKAVWESGQAYVALSRCTSLEGLFLKRSVNKTDIILDPLILEFANGFNNESVYCSSLKAKQKNKEALLKELSSWKAQYDELKIIEIIESLQTLSLNLIESFHLLSLKAYCYFKSKNVIQAKNTVDELKKYETLRKAIGPLTYDSILSALHGAELMMEDNTMKRGREKINMLCEVNVPETIKILKDMVYDLPALTNKK